MSSVKIFSYLFCSFRAGSPKGFKLEVDLKYLEDSWESRNDYSLASEKIKIKKNVLYGYEWYFSWKSLFVIYMTRSVMVYIANIYCFIWSKDVKLKKIHRVLTAKSWKVYTAKSWKMWEFNNLINYKEFAMLRNCFKQCNKFWNVYIRFQ